MLTRPGRRLFIRLLLLLFFVIISLSLYFFPKFRPPYQFYEKLFVAEEGSSLDLLKNRDSEGNLKFVKFRQLQGAGFNNQVNELV